jgi:RNA-directed DNA polymerase
MVRGNYFRSGTSDREFHWIDEFVVRRLRRWEHRRGGQRSSRRRELPFAWYHGHGLYRLRGTVCYPVQATPVRSSLSRVRENRTHGLIGGS